jgi:prohibitin 1
LKKKLIQILQRLSLGLSFVALILCFLFVILYHQMVHTIPVGHTSVVWHRIPWAYTSTSEGPLSEGVKIIMPWDKLYTYDLRLQTKRQAYEVVSKDGLHFQLTLSFRWRAIRENIVDLNQTLGPNYVGKLLIPEIGSTIREVVAHYSAEDLYTSARASVQKQVYESTTSDSIKNGIASQFDHLTKKHKDVVSLMDILIEKVELPEKIKQAIENKLKQAQVAQEYVYRLDRERLESQRKLIEAKGIRDFQKTVAPAITESYLRWRGIEATLKLSESGNSKVVVIGNSATGLPLILDTRSVDVQLPPSLSPDRLSGGSKTGTDVREDAPDEMLPSRNLSKMNKKTTMKSQN